MHAKYLESVDLLQHWSGQDDNIRGVVLLGSQVRTVMPGDEWSDLDVLIFARDADLLTKETQWTRAFGDVVLTSEETADLSFAGLIWHVLRVLYADGRVIDFSIIPSRKMDTALEINREIHASGYRVLYDAMGNVIQTKIEASLAAVRDERPAVPSKAALDAVIRDLLFHMVWAGRKLMRRELWTAVRCINLTISGLLIRLIEYSSAFVSGRDYPITYEGRFLEQRTDEGILRGLQECASKYDREDAWKTLHALMDFVQSVSADLYDALDYPWDENLFGTVRSMLQSMNDRGAGI